jgi:hypothetical protein
LANRDSCARYHGPVSKIEQQWSEPTTHLSPYFFGILGSSDTSEHLISALGKKAA